MHRMWSEDILLTVYHTPNNVPYLKEPQLVLVGNTRSHIAPNHGVDEYVSNLYPSGWMDDEDADIDDALIMFAGQLCYQSFGQQRTPHANSSDYIQRIIESRHFSVLEHVSVSYLFYGVSRSLTHELVRHRHLSFSQVSQRYVNQVRFVERPEFQLTPHLHGTFLERIEQTAASYAKLIDYLSSRDEYKSITPLTERRKAVQQVARAILPNETEAPILVTGNLRSWRHFINLRASPFAETEIQRLAHLVFKSLLALYPSSFQDYDPITLTTPNTEQ